MVLLIRRSTRPPPGGPRQPWTIERAAFRRTVALSAALIAAALGARAARACTTTWKGTTASFSAASNWSANAIPGASDDVCFDGSVANQPMTLDANNVTLRSLTIQNAYQSAITSTVSTLTITGSLTLNSTKVGSSLQLPTGTTKIGGAFAAIGKVTTLDSHGGTVLFNAGSGAVSHTFNGQSFNKIIVNDGLGAYWKLDESSGTALADQSGYGNALTLSAASFTSSPPSVSFTDGSAVAFTGAVSASLTASPPAGIPAVNAAKTVGAWIKLGSTAVVQDAIALGDGTNGVKLGIQSVGSLAVWTWGASPTTLASTLAPTDGAWHQVTYTYDGTTNRLYLDGVLANSTSTTPPTATTTVVDLGSYDGTHELMANNSAIDEVRVYNRALTAAEVSGLAFGNMPATGVAIHTFSDPFSSTGDLVIASGIVTGTKTVADGGSWFNYGGAFTGSGTVTLSAASGTLLTGTQPFQGNITIGSGASYTLADRLWVGKQTVTVTGTLVDPLVNASSYVAHIGALAGAGTFTPNKGTVVLDTAQTLTKAGANFNNLRVENPNEANVVAYWKLDEGAGSTTYDFGGSADTGTLGGGVSWTAGASASVGFDDAAGLRFDGSSGFVSTLVKNIPKAGKSETISAWVKLGSTSGTQDFVSFTDGVGGGIKLGLLAGQLAAWNWGTSSALVSATAPTDGLWHSVVYVYDGTNNNLYLDGVVATTTTANTTSATIAQGFLGSADGTQEYLNGTLDDVRVYSTNLSATRVAQLAAGRYAGTGGAVTVGLGGSTTVGGALSLDNGSLTDTDGTSSYPMTVALTGAINSGSYTVTGGAQTFSGTLTVQQSGSVSLSGGSVTSGALTTFGAATVSLSAGALSCPSITAQGTSAVSLSGGSVTTTGDVTLQSGTSLTMTGGSVSCANLTVQSTSTVTLGGASSVALGSNDVLTMDGTLITTSTSGISPTIASQSGSYTFKVGSTAAATPTLNIAGLAVKNLDSNGMWINAVTGATTTFTEFDSIAFSGGTGNQLLQITAPVLYLPSNGCTFDNSTTYAIKLVGDGSDQTRAVFGDATCATNDPATGLCATSEKSDDDANNDGIADTPGNGKNLGAVVQFTRAATFSGGLFQGFPTAAFDWNTFTYYSTYSVFRNQAGSADIVNVTDESGNVLYSWSTASNQNITGTPQWSSTTVAGVTTHYLYVTVIQTNATNQDKVYRLIDSPGGKTLIPDTVGWTTNPYNCGCTIKSEASLDANNVYWAATTGTSGAGTLKQVLMEVGQSNQSVMTGWTGGLAITSGSATASPPTLVTSGATNLYLGINSALLQLDVSTTSFNANTTVGSITGRVSYGTSFLPATSGTTRVFAGDNNGKMWAISPSSFTGTLWSYAPALGKIVGSYYDATTDTVQFGVNKGAIVVLTGAGAALTGYPYTLNASDPISSSPLYYSGVLAVGTTLGKLYFIDRSTTSAGGSPAVIKEYYFGPTENVSAIGYDANKNRYMVSVSSSTLGVKDGRLYYFDSVTDPTPTFQ
jgi:hypothetical protein